MIAAGEPREFYPFGREHIRSYHPGKGCSSAATTCAKSLPKVELPVLDQDYLQSSRGQCCSPKETCILMEGSSFEGNEKWVLKEGADGSEEELYIFGHVVVWSKNNGSGMFKMEKSFTLDSPVKQALWCDSFKNNSSFIQDKILESALPNSICVLENLYIHVITENGHVFTTPLPFQVSKIWDTEFGIIIVRNPVATDDIYQKNNWDNFPLVFNILYPHNDITPVVTSKGKLSYFMDVNEEIVITTKSPSLLISYNKLSKLHNVWRVRKTTKEEKDITGERANTSSVPSSFWPGFSPISFPTTSASSKIVSGSSTQSKYSHLTFSPSQSFCGSPKTKTFISKTSFTDHSSPTSKVSSPLASNLTQMAAISRSQTPLTSAHHRMNFPSPVSSLHPSFSPRIDHLTGHFSESFMCEVGVPIMPDICFEHVWTDKYCASSKSEKAFFTSDIAGQNFLCIFLKEEKKLSLVKFEESNDMNKLIFGAVSYVSAKDVEPLKSLQMLFVLDELSTFTLYTGPVKVCKVYIPGSLGLGDVLPSVSRWRESLLTGTPRRSSLAATSKTQNALEAKFQVKYQMLSPVQAQMESSLTDYSFSEDSSITSLVTKIRDGISYNVTLQTSNEEYFKIALPKLSSSEIVTRILKALKSVLPKDIASQILLKWYTTRNAPGPRDASAQTELVCFFQCLLGILGYDVEVSGISDKIADCDWSASPVERKKFKNSEQGSDVDFISLTRSKFGKSVSLELQQLGLQLCDSHSKSFPFHGQATSINTSSPIYIYLPSILFTLHLVYEDLKLNTLNHNFLPLMAKVLYQLAGSIGLNHYQDHYWRDIPYVCSDKPFVNADGMALGDGSSRSLQIPNNFPQTPPSIINWLIDCVANKPVSPFPYIPCGTKDIKNIILLYLHLRGVDVNEEPFPEKYLSMVIAPGMRKPEDLESVVSLMKMDSDITLEERIVQLLSNLKITIEDLNNIPFGISLPLEGVLFHCRRNPPSNWPKEAYNLIRRQELAVLTQEIPPTYKRSNSSSLPANRKTPSNKEEDDGFDHIDYSVLNLRFSKDQRVHDVCRMLQSSSPVRVALVQRPEVSDHEFLEEQEKYLYTLCIRTMALPTGRGMFTLRTCMPVVTETLPIPKLCLTGRSPPRNNTIELTHIDVPSNMNMWPLFHNGVAAGLRITPNAEEIHSTWIVYNKPKSTNSLDSPTEHAGFLMGLGLNGHLKNLTTMSVHDYLCKNQELTGVGLLLGLAASKLGTMDVSTTKIMSIHLEALLPPTSTELDVPPMIQVAAVLGVGLLYQGSVHRHIAEVLLGEIGRPPGPEMEHCIDRESYALASGLALGLVTLGRGSEVAALSDLPIADQLFHFMVGGHKRPLTGIHKEKQKSPSYQIREGDSVNVDVTSPGATLALGMMFFNTGNRSIAEWMEVPDTQYLLDMVRPDFLMLRTISYSLIMWDEVLPSKSWVESHLPLIVSTHALKKGQANSDIDHETMSQAYCNVVAGACMSLGLKFAGSANEEAFETLFHFARMFLSLSGKPVAEQAGKSTIETCLNVTVLSLAMVMTGTGDIEVLRLCRHLRSRISHASSYVQYGSHMATHMALGLLFLGGGRFTLKTTPGAIGALLCAFFPKFPTHSNDNRYHLQAFRHLYALAVEPRLVIPRDIDTGKVVYTHFKIFFKDTDRYRGSHYTVKGPCILPELTLLKEVIVEDSRYWPIKFDHQQNWKLLRTLLERDGYVYVKQKAGCLPYTEDPKGFRSVLSQCIMQDSVHGWTVKPTAMTSFSSDPLVLNFSSAFLLPSSKIIQEGVLQKQQCALLFECATMEKTEAFPIYLQLVQLLTNSPSDSCLSYKQLNLIIEYQKKFPERSMLVNADYVLSLRNALEKDIHSSVKNILPHLSKYLRGQTVSCCAELAPFLVFYGIPQFKLDTNISGSLPTLYMKLKHMKLPQAALATLLSALKM